MASGEAASYDIIVVGSGAGGMVAALRAHDLGLSVMMAEKSHHYGGTSAISGGCTWIPMNDAIAGHDSVEQAMTYLRAACKGQAREETLRAFVENAPVMTKYLEGVGVKSVSVTGYPDYYSELPGAVLSRAMISDELDGALLGDEFFRLREHHPFLLAFNRYAMNFEMAATLSARLPGWRRVAFKMLWDYWSDIPWRLKTRRDRRLTMGRALIGGLRKAMMDRNIPLFLRTKLVSLERKDGRVSAAVFERNGQEFRAEAHKAVILASGGFEHCQEMRERYLPTPTAAANSLTPVGDNAGDGLRAGREMGAAIENMEHAWWAPTVRMPARDTPNVDVPYQLFFERGRPGTLSVNRLGKRFVDEGVSYDRFGQAMIADQKKTGANMPCWMIFDATFRSKHPASGVMPAWVMPDSSLPQDWWDTIVYRAASLRELARKISVDEDALSETVANMNRYAKTGVDEEFGRGSTTYDKFFGEPGVTPNCCLGPLERAPFYAMRVELGDLGTKGA